MATNGRVQNWESIISAYIMWLQNKAGQANESGRAIKFFALLKDLFDIDAEFVEKYAQGLEKYIRVKQKDGIRRGRIDELFGNLVIEFEKNLQKTQSDAEEQLRRYIAYLWSQEEPGQRNPYICLAGDGRNFIAYSPIIQDTSQKEIQPDEVRLEPIEQVDVCALDAQDIYLWLDRYFLRKEVLTPTTEEIVKDFGAKSHAFQTVSQTLLSAWRSHKAESEFAVVYDSWEKYLRIVYGSEIAGDELFARHTYLATLAKLMAYTRIAGVSPLESDKEILSMLNGEIFREVRIENFLEEDFFSWVSRKEAAKTGLSVVRWLFSILRKYNLQRLSEDVLKSLYQGLVDPQTRHDLGEFYTPDWLAHRIVKKLLSEKPEGSVLDPACGSGTFLYLAIREKRERLGDSQKTLRHILDSVCGADVHPLATIIAKTNYILALGDLLRRPGGRGTVSLPIYLADTLRLPEKVSQDVVEQIPSYKVELDGTQINLLEPLLKETAVYDQAIELAKEFARQNKGRKITEESFINFITAQDFALKGSKPVVESLFHIAEALKTFIEKNRDTIWAFILKNAYKPLFFKNKFDFVVGNPPWIAFRYMEPNYQGFLKGQITNKYRLLTGRGHLITHLEVASLFLVRAADLYLKSGGEIAFVLPKSIFSADQHDGLRRRTFRFPEDLAHKLLHREVWDCENVEPLFNVPACVLIAEKGKIDSTTYPLKGEILSGKLDRKNAPLADAEKALAVTDVEFLLHTRGKRSFWATEKTEKAKEESFYKQSFFQGATIVPRSFWFVQVKSSLLGFNPDLPPLETADRAVEQAKDAYKSVFFTGNVESRFLYATLLSTDLLPFGHLGFRLVVLPIEPAADKYHLITSKEARKRGFYNLAQWLEKAEEEWTKRRGAKRKQITALDWLDYRKKLTSQNPQAKYAVIYNTSGTYLTASLVEMKDIQSEASGFVADTKTYFLELDNRRECFFLVAILNAPLIDSLTKPMQSRGLWGPRDFHKKPLELPIPQFDAANATHLRLAELGKECTHKVEKWVKSGGAGKIKSIGKLRSMVRKMLKPELTEIDNLVKELLKEKR
jgi:hypothetical protein